ncbi:MAG: stage IV sporulation protein A [Eubacteriales bacterium]|nr:stage IV sporulation protein A [Eubacteriales bacterium]
MDRNSIYRDIAGRTDGDIYIGVVGPVRTGKSAFIKRFMELAVLPEIAQETKRERLRDEMPLSGAGKTIMTTQPRFVPDEAVELPLAENTVARIRLADCAGYLIDGALGLEENGESRMVRTPWFEHDIPFEQAAEIGTRKVIDEHSTIGLVVTTDGSFSSLPRAAYEEAEARVVRELKALAKPFSVVLNSAEPNSAAVQALSSSLQDLYGVPVVPVRAPEMTEEDLRHILAGVLMEFPIREAVVRLPSWLGALPQGHPLYSGILDSITGAAKQLRKMKDAPAMSAAMAQLEGASEAQLRSSQLNDGTLDYELRLRDGLFYETLGQSCGQEIDSEERLFALMTELAFAKREYDRVAEALASARKTGYGMVPPSMDEMRLQEPQISKQGSRFGVKLNATAPSLHLMRVDIQTEVNPLVGSEQQGEELVKFLLSEFETDPAQLWQTDIFGKPLSELVREGLSGKLGRMPDSTQAKMREALEKIINEGTGGMICILL